MTFNHTLAHTFPELAKFDKYFIGADKFFNKIHQTADMLANSAAASGYPPFNLKKIDENKYAIEIAVAGFSKQDIELTLDDGRLIVKSNVSYDTEENEKYLHKGISSRAFTRTFTLADNVVVNDAHLINGMLRIWLEHLIPEEKKPKSIPINEVNEETKKLDSK